MAVLTATVDAARALVRLYLDWSDEAAVTAVTVVRIVDGVETPVRLPGPLDDDGQYLLSHGLAVLYDTEAPLDVPVLYEARSTVTKTLVRSAPQPPTPMVSDAFARTVVDTWAAPDVGQPYRYVGGDQAFDVDGTKGTITLGAAGASLRAVTDGPLEVDAAVDVGLSQVATGAAVWAGLLLREQDADNTMRAELVFNTDGSVDSQFTVRRGGVDYPSGGLGNLFNYAAGAMYRIHAQWVGNTVRMNAWALPGAEPAGWQVERTSDAIRVAGDVGVRARLDSGNTNAGLVVYVDNLAVTDLAGAAVTVPSSGAAWLKDPLRPAGDVRVELGKPGAACSTEQRVWFVGFTEETYAADSSAFEVVDAPRPDVAASVRKDATGTLLLATRTLADRDRLLAMLAGGTPLLFQAPPEYGWPDRYLAVGDVVVSRIAADHRKPWRRLALPFVVVDAPAGPAEGVPGVRWDDMCNQYATWQQFDASGLTGVDVLFGEAA